MEVPSTAAAHRLLFLENIVDLTVYHPSFGQREISRTKNRELFDLTVGGFGLTGLIIKATIRVVPVNTDILNVSHRRFSSLVFVVGTDA